MHMRAVRPLALLGLAALAACSGQDDATSVRQDGDAPAPLLAAAAGRGVPGSYIVVLKEGARPATIAKRNGLTPRYVYSSALNGFAVQMADWQIAKLRGHPSVAYIEQDARVELTTTQSGATWGLDRIDQRDRPLNGTYTYTPTGAGVRVYVVDTGIRFAHNEFGGRAVTGYDAVDGGSADDCNGHGTHVAGTVGGATYGVAKGVTLVGVRVLDCAGNGTNSGVIAGMDWVANNRVLPAVANLSLGGGASTAVDDALNRMHNRGVAVVVAAGNSGANACNESPGRAPNAITVGSTTSTDTRSSFSNYGTCVDVFAPGSSITSAWYNSNTATSTIDGTSMAAPHVAGAAALYLQGNTAALPSAVASAIINTATTGKVVSPGTGSPNRLLFSPLTGAVVTPPTEPTAPCTGCTLYTGTLAGTGATEDEPNGNYYQSTVSGTHRGWLRGPTTGADFDLYLYKWNGSSWVIVARGESSTSSEDVSYSGTAGYYVWEVSSYSGSGSYNFWMTKP
jgi:subtilisin family serine protease